MSERTNVIIDCDPGIDDAVALALAYGMSDKINIIGVTTVAGNVGIENTTRNALNILNLIGAGDIPVAKGAECPIAREPLRASGVHGVTGLRGHAFSEDSMDALVDIGAVDFMYEKISECDTKVTVVLIGPVTNAAILIDKYPNIKEKIDKFVFMGTSHHDGNPTSVATFNVLVDPEAFRKLLFCKVPFYACPLETTRTAHITAQETIELRAIGNKTSEMLANVIEACGVDKIGKDEVIDEKNEEAITAERIAASADNSSKDLHDPATVAYLTHPELFTVNKYYCDVECSGELTTGFTLIDKRDYYRKSEEDRNLFLLESIDREGFIKILFDAVRNCN